MSRLQELPIDPVLPEIIGSLKSSGACVLKAEPGAGKTTRVPPAILDAGLGKLSDGQPGLIVVLQPRRVAARAAATRISDELGTAVGDLIGYQVRFERRASRNTRILICTEGIFLRRLQDDPFLESTAAVVFDEFHERSIDSDLALAMVRQVRNEVRPDLTCLVMSATLDPKPIAEYLGGCPTVECPGRTYPVDIEFLSAPSNDYVDRLAADGVKKLLSRTSGDLLVFLPGTGEIRQTHDLLLPISENEDFVLMQLYGDMPLEDQQRVLQPLDQRKVILSTNVAETSLTINGVTAVVDSGLARVNRLDAQLGLNRLEVGRISRASADQRAGRAGRTKAGMCLRLWSEREHQMMRAFETPEVSRVELSQCLLQLIAWGENDVAAFPWFEPPPAATVEQALQLLCRLDALENGKLTNTGKAMSRLPLQPRLARLVLEGVRFGVADRAALCATMLAERDPFRRPPRDFKAEHHSYSDVLDRIFALEDFADRGLRHSRAGELLSGPAKQILRGANDLVRQLNDLTISPDNVPREVIPLDQDQPSEDLSVLRALLTAFPDRVCRRREPGGRRALMVGGRGVRLADESAVAEGDLFVAVESVDTGQAETLVRQASLVEKSWLPASQVSSAIDVVYDPTREKVMAVKRLKFCDLALEESPVAMPAGVDASEILQQAAQTHFDLSQLADDEAKQYLARINCLRDWMPELELPDFGSNPWLEILPEWCMGSSSIAELRSTSLVPILQSRLMPAQISAVDREAPDKVSVPSGRQAKIEYEAGKPPVLAVRIQELYGLADTPKIAGSRIAVLLHLLAPNYRVQQITSDLASFWKNTYADVRKDLRSRYPKHSWPENPLTAAPEQKPQRKK